MFLVGEFDELEDLLAAHGIVLCPFPRLPHKGTSFGARGKVGMGVLLVAIKDGRGRRPPPQPSPARGGGGSDRAMKFH